MTTLQRPSRRRTSLNWFGVTSAISPAIFIASMLAILAVPLRAAIVRGTITDPLGAPVHNARVELLQNGQVAGYTVTAADGSYEIKTAQAGRFNIAASGGTFRLTLGEGLYAGALDVVQRDIVLRPQGVEQRIVVTATGTPTPQAQVSSAVSVIPEQSLVTRSEILDELRLMPGTDVVQTGQYGGATSLFIRGGNSDANKIIIDGIPAEDVGGRFDFGNVSSTGLASIETYRGPDSVIYGSDAAAGVVAFQTPHGETARPVLNYSGDAGNFYTYRNEVTVGGTRKKLDYFAGFSRFDSSNALPRDKYHNATAVANLGYNLFASTQLRFTARNGVTASGLPGAHDFFGIANNGKQGDQDLYLGATLDNQTSARWHNLVRYSVARKREQATQYAATGTPVTFAGPGYSYTEYYGSPVTIRGANGYSATGQAVLEYSNTSKYLNVSNRDQLQYQSDFKFNPHFVGFLGFTYEDERGSFKPADPAETTGRRNYDYTLGFQGDIRNRLFYSLGGGIEKNHLYGVEGTPRLGLAWYPVRPGTGALHGTKLRFNFAKGVQEPSLSSEFYSLHTLLNQQGDAAAIQQFHVAPIGAERSRSYDGGVEQSILSEKVLLKLGYFHNEFGRQIEFVDPGTLGAAFGLSQDVVALLNNTNGGAELNSLDFSAQGVETSLEWRVLPALFVRGGYTYLDAKVQHSFSGDNVFGASNPNLPNVPIGSSSPLIGARPFRRPPHTGFLAVEYTGRKWNAALKGGFASRSDDSTFLSYSDLNGDNTLLLPNRNLDFGYSKLDASALYQVTPHIAMFTQLNNLLNQQHIGPIGYPALPFNFRAGLKLRLGGE